MPEQEMVERGAVKRELTISDYYYFVYNIYRRMIGVLTFILTRDLPLSDAKRMLIGEIRRQAEAHPVLPPETIEEMVSWIEEARDLNELVDGMHHIISSIEENILSKPIKEKVEKFKYGLQVITNFIEDVLGGALATGKTTPERVERAMEIISEQSVYYLGKGDYLYFQVESQREPGKFYNVDVAYSHTTTGDIIIIPANSSCECEDYKNGYFCKHLIATLLTIYFAPSLVNGRYIDWRRIRELIGM